MPGVYRFVLYEEGSDADNISEKVKPTLQWQAVESLRATSYAIRCRRYIASYAVETGGTMKGGGVGVTCQQLTNRSSVVVLCLVYSTST